MYYTFFIAAIASLFAIIKGKSYVTSLQNCSKAYSRLQKPNEYDLRNVRNFENIAYTLIAAMIICYCLENFQYVTYE